LKRRPTSGRALAEAAFRAVGWVAVLLPLLAVGVLVVELSRRGAPRLDAAFLTGFPSRHAASAGILPAVAGSLWLVVLTAALALPIGIGAAVYLEEYGSRSRLAALVEVNIANLAGVPSIVYGLLGLGLFVRTLALGRSVLAGACTLALLVLPVVILVSREALRAVPHTLREASLALGATRLTTLRTVVLPMAAPGILTGTILACSRALGETAPLVVLGAAAYVGFVPDGPGSAFTALPVQIFHWVSRPDEAFLANAAAAVMVLLLTLLLLNATAIVLRDRLRRAS
jgi:phosphate transport system permease protein